MSNGHLLLTDADFEKEIARLTAERDARKVLMAEPKQKAVRGERRAQLIGAWFVATGLGLAPDAVANLVSISGDDGWLFDVDILREDGWQQTDKDVWFVPRKS